MLSLSQRPIVVRNIFHLGVKTQLLMHRALNLGWYDAAKQFQKFDQALPLLLRKTAHFDFIGQVAQGRTLLVGEGRMAHQCGSALENQDTFSTWLFKI